MRRAFAMLASVLPCVGMVPVVGAGDTDLSSYVGDGVWSCALEGSAAPMQRLFTTQAAEYHDGVI